MPQLVIAPIVEGHGDVAAFPILLRRIVVQFAPGAAIDVLQPIRQPRSRLISDENACLTKAVGLARLKLQQRAAPDTVPFVLIALDADNDCAARLGPETITLAQSQHVGYDIGCVLAVSEYETWFVAAAESLEKYLRLPAASEIPCDPETQGCRKAWIQQRFRGPKYSETVDQPKLTSTMDLQLCRSRAPSFDKLCREILSRCQAVPPT